MIFWTRVPRQGFIASHWVGLDAPDGRALFRIDQRKPATASRHNNTRMAYLAALPRGTAKKFPNVAAAKAAAAQAAKELGFVS